MIQCADLKKSFILAILASGVFSEKVSAQSEFSVYAKAGVVQDSNLFKVDDSGVNYNSSEASDQIIKISTGLDYALNYRLQKFNFSIDGASSEYQKYSFLNNTSYSMDGSWGWILFNTLSGSLGISESVKISDFEELDGVVKNEVNNKSLSLSSTLIVGPHVNLVFGLGQNDVTNSSNTRAALDRREHTGSFSLNFISNKGNVLGLGMDVIKGESLSALESESINLSYNFNQVISRIFMKWQLTEKSGVDLSYGAVERVYDQGSARDFSGSNYRIDYSLNLTDKSKILFSLYENLSSSSNLISSSVSTVGLNVALETKLTSQLRLGVSLEQEERSSYVVTGSVINDVDKLVDEYSSVRLSAGYEINRSASTDLSYITRARASNSLLRDFQSQVLTLNFNLTF